MKMQKNPKILGKIIQIIGAVIDVEFQHDNIPAIYEAIVVEKYNLTSNTFSPPLN